MKTKHNSTHINHQTTPNNTKQHRDARSAVAVWAFFSCLHRPFPKNSPEMSQPVLTPVMPNVGIGKKLRAKFKQLGKSRDSQPRDTTPLTVETTNTLIDYLYRIGAEQTEGIFRICGRTESVRALYESLTDKSPFLPPLCCHQAVKPS